MSEQSDRRRWHIIQARLGSKRLPGKVLMPLGRRTILGTILFKLLSSGIPTDEIILATTNLPEDAPICREAETYGIPWFIGSEFDVLDRFTQAIPRANDLDIVIRLTADNPFVDIHLMQDLVRLFTDENIDYVAPAGCAIGSGSEVFSVSALRAAHAQTFMPSHREHVTPFIRENRAMFTTKSLAIIPNRSNIRLTIDTASDLMMAKRLYAQIGEPLLEWHQESICQFLDEHPEIRALNQHIEQKTS